MSATWSIPPSPVLGLGSFGRRGEASLPCVTDGARTLLTSSGRAAIFLALRGLGVTSGQRVLVPTYHCPSMVAPVEQVGAAPMFFPLVADGLPDLRWLRQQDLARVRAMLVAHYFGLPISFAAVRAFCDENGIALIEDCAHAFFGAVQGQAVGSFGDVAIASLTKFFPVVDGGCLIQRTNRMASPALDRPGWVAEVRAAADVLELATRYRRMGRLLGVPLRALFALKDLVRGGGALHVDADAIGVPTSAEAARMRLDEQLARRAASGVTRWIVRAADRNRIVEQRRANYRLFCELFSTESQLAVLFPQLPEQAAPYVCPVRVEFADARYRALRRRGVPVMRWDQTWPGTPAIEGDVGGSWARGVFQFVCHQDLSRNDVRFAASALFQVLREVRP